MQDGVNASVEGEVDGLGAAAVGQHRAIAVVGFVYDDLQLLQGEGRAVGVAGQRAAAGGSYFYEVCAVLDPLPDGLPDAVCAVHLAAHEPEMSAGNGKGRTCDQGSRAFRQAQGQPFLQRKGGPVPRTAVAQGGHSGRQMIAHVPGRPEQSNVVRIVAVHLLAGAPVAGHIGVSVEVEQAGQKGGIRVFPHVHRSVILGILQVAPSPNPSDSAFGEGYSHALLRRVLNAVNELAWQYDLQLTGRRVSQFRNS